MVTDVGRLTRSEQLRHLYPKDLPMPSPVTRRVVAVASALALGVVGTLAATPAFATPASDYVVSQSWQAKEGGRIAVTVTFARDIDAPSVEQGWYGSGTVFTKVYYRTKSVLVPFRFSDTRTPFLVPINVDATAPTAPTWVQTYSERDGGRAVLTVTFSEPVTLTEPSQGWNGSGTVFSKVYYREGVTATVNYKDAVGNPGSSSFIVGSIVAPVL